MKKITALVLALAMASAVLTGCGDPCKDGHTAGEWKIDTEATCTTEGSRHQNCKVCGETIKTEVIPAGHTGLVTEKGTASFTQSGTTDKIYCEACGEVVQESQEVEAGMYSDVRYNENQPTYVVKKVKEDFSWDGIEKAMINVESWKDRFGYDPEAEFQVVHTDSSIIIKFVCHNDLVTSVQTETNSIVCGDACVEFFISPSSDPEHYYNFEMNALGTLHLGYGAEAQNRTIVDPDIIHRNTVIEVYQNSENFAQTADGPRGEWGLTITINKAIFKEVSGIDFEAKLAKSGFYKCSDLPKLTKEKRSQDGHLLSWNTIDTKNRNNQGYHTVSDFGNLAFED